MSVLLLRCICFLSALSLGISAYAGNSGFGSEFESADVRPRYISPFVGIKKVAIVPFFALTDAIDTSRFSLAFSSQMENYPGWEIIYPQMVAMLAKSLDKTIVTPHDAITIARQLGADAVILGEIRDFDAYYPPRIVIKVSLYRTNLYGGSRDIMNLDRQGIATSDTSFKRGQAIYTLSESYDAGREHVMKLIKRYAALFNQSKDPLRYDLFLHSQDRFFEAISYTIRQDMLYAQTSAAARQEKEADGSPTEYGSISRAEDYRATNPRYKKKHARRNRRGTSD